MCLSPTLPGVRYEDFKNELRRANLSVTRFAALLDMKAVSITNYRARGSVPRHLAVIATLLAELVERGADVETLLRSPSGNIHANEDGE